MRALLAAALAVALAAPAAAQAADSLARPPQPPVEVGGPTPRGAVTRALLLPGLGQVYNGQTLKAPFATALVAGAVVYFVDRQRQYVFYRRAAVVAGCLQDGGATDPDRAALCADAAANYQDEYDSLNAGRSTPLPFASLRTVRAQARGQRDVGAVVVLAAYALQALDAYVSAELADFDVSEDLGLRVLPAPDGPRLGLRVRL